MHTQLIFRRQKITWITSQLGLTLNSFGSPSATICFFCRYNSENGNKYSRRALWISFVWLSVYCKHWFIYIICLPSMMRHESSTSRFNTLRPRQNGRHFPDDIFKCIFVNEKIGISIKISPQFMTEGPIKNIPVLLFSFEVDHLPLAIGFHWMRWRTPIFAVEMFCPCIFNEISLKYTKSRSVMGVNFMS